MDTKAGLITRDAYFSRMWGFNTRIRIIRFWIDATDKSRGWYHSGIIDHSNGELL